MSLLSGIAHLAGNAVNAVDPFANNTGGIVNLAKQPTWQPAAAQTLNSPPPNADSGTGNTGVLGASTSNLGAGNLAANPNQTSIDLINSALGRLPGQLQSADANIQNQFNTNQNQLQSGHDQAQQGYNQSTAQNGQQFVTNKNQIDSQASNGLHGLLAILGAHGAGGSSAAQYAAPNAVGQVAAEQRSGAGQTFGQNQQALDTNWNGYQSGFDNSKKQLNDWLGQQQNAAQSQSEQTKQGLLQQLLGLQSSTAAAQPFVDQINQSADTVDQLANFNPTYNGTTPVYQAPSVASYTAPQTGAPVLNGPSGNTGAGVSPLQFLLGLKDKQQLQPQF